MDALLLIDIQNSFLPGGVLAVPRGDLVIPVANRLMPLFEEILATQDWHPPNHQSFAAMHPGKAVGEVIDLHGLPQTLWPAHCVQHSFGAALADKLNKESIKQVFRKGVDPRIDSYSGFFDNGRGQATGLEEYLRQRKISKLYVVGLATDYCVKFTVLDALHLGFETTVIVDGCRGIDLQPGQVKAALEQMRAAGAELIESSTLIAARHTKKARPAHVLTQ